MWPVKRRVVPRRVCQVAGVLVTELHGKCRGGGRDSCFLRFAGRKEVLVMVQRVAGGRSPPAEGTLE